MLKRKFIQQNKMDMSFLFFFCFPLTILFPLFYVKLNVTFSHEPMRMSLYKKGLPNKVLRKNWGILHFEYFSSVLKTVFIEMFEIG